MRFTGFLLCVVILVSAGCTSPRPDATSPANSGPGAEKQWNSTHDFELHIAFRTMTDQEQCGPRIVEMRGVASQVSIRARMVWKPADDSTEVLSLFVGENNTAGNRTEGSSPVDVVSNSVHLNAGAVWQLIPFKDNPGFPSSTVERATQPNQTVAVRVELQYSGLEAVKLNEREIGCLPWPAAVEAINPSE